MEGRYKRVLRRNFNLIMIDYARTNTPVLRALPTEAYQLIAGKIKIEIWPFDKVYTVKHNT